MLESEVRWLKEEKQSSVVCVKMVIQGKKGDKSTVRGSVSVHVKKQGIKNGSLAEYHRRTYTRMRKYYCHGQWCQRWQKDQGDADMILFVIFCI